MYYLYFSSVLPTNEDNSESESRKLTCSSSDISLNPFYYTIQRYYVRLRGI